MQPKAALKPTKIWIFLLIAPFCALILTSFAQVGARYALSHQPTSCRAPFKTDLNPDGSYSSDSSSGVSKDLNAPQLDCDPVPSSQTVIKLIINIVSLLLGIAAIVGIFLSPLWIVMLVKASSYNEQLKAGANTQSPKAPTSV